VSVYLDTQGATDAPWDQFYAWGYAEGILAADGGRFELPVETDTDVSGGDWLGRRPPSVSPSVQYSNGGFRFLPLVPDYVEAPGSESLPEVSAFDSVLAVGQPTGYLSASQPFRIFGTTNENTDDRVEVFRANLILGYSGLHTVTWQPYDAGFYDSSDLLHMQSAVQSLMLTVSTTVEAVSTHPFIFHMSGNRDPVYHGKRLLMTLDRVADSQDDVARVRFLRDTNHNGLLDPHDEFLGRDKTGDDGWSFSALSDPSWGVGTTRFFAEAIDEQGHRSDTVSIDVDIIAPGMPYIQRVTASPYVTDGNQLIEIRARGVLDPFGSVAKVRFFRDVDGNGRLNTSDELLFVQRETRYTGFPFETLWDPAWGEDTTLFFAQAVDNEGNKSLIKSTEITFFALSESVGPPCPADRNADGWVGAGDLALFLNAYADKDPSADIDGLPGVDQLDLIRYVELWQKGCE